MKSRRLVSTTALLALSAGVLSACAHGGTSVAAAPTESPANARAMLYALCAVDGGSMRAVVRVGRYVRLTCSGVTAHSLFDAAEAFSRNRGRETREGAVVIRRIGAEPWFDACRHDESADTYRCVVHLLAPVDFLDPEKDSAAPPKAR